MLDIHVDVFRLRLDRFQHECMDQWPRDKASHARKEQEEIQDEGLDFLAMYDIRRPT